MEFTFRDAKQKIESIDQKWADSQARNVTHSYNWDYSRSSSSQPYTYTHITTPNHITPASIQALENDIRELKDLVVAQHEHIELLEEKFQLLMDAFEYMQANR